MRARSRPPQSPVRDLDASLRRPVEHVPRQRHAVHLYIEQLVLHRLPHPVLQGGTPLAFDDLEPVDDLLDPLPNAAMFRRECRWRSTSAAPRL